MRNSLWTTVGGLALLAMSATISSAAVIAPQLATDVITGQQLANPPFTLGWEFLANKNITVNALGFFDDSQNGLAESHLVGLWDSAGNLLAETKVLSSDQLVAQFRYDAVAPVTLAAGKDYFVGALYATGADNVVFPRFSGVSTTSNITYLNATYAEGSSLQDPVLAAGVNGFFGPNISAVPEPGTWAMLLLGFAGLCFAAYRQKRAAKTA